MVWQDEGVLSLMLKVGKHDKEILQWVRSKDRLDLTDGFTHF